MGSRFTRRRFLTAASAGAAYLVLIPTVGCEPPERSSKVRSSRTPRVKPLPTAPFPPEGVWAFRSRPDLNPPAVEVTTVARDELTFEERSGGSQPTVPVNARYAAPVLAALRNRRRVNLEPNAGADHREYSAANVAP